jgi:hypothetical protein
MPSKHSAGFLNLNLSGEEMPGFVAAVSKILEQPKFAENVQITSQTSRIARWVTEIESRNGALLMEFVAELAMEMPSADEDDVEEAELLPNENTDPDVEIPGQFDEPEVTGEDDWPETPDDEPEDEQPETAPKLPKKPLPKRKTGNPAVSIEEA